MYYGVVTMHEIKKVFVLLGTIIVSALVADDSKKMSQFAIETRYIQIGCCWKMSGTPPNPKRRKYGSRPWLRIAFPFWVNDYDLDESNGVNGIVISPLLDFSPVLNGVAFAPVCFETKCNGVVFAPFVSIPACLNGLSIAPVNFCVDGHSVQLGVMNWRGVFGRGSGQKHNGLAQIGICNRALETNRFQIGLFNDSRRKQESVDSNPYLQIGLVNLSDVTNSYSTKKDNETSSKEKETSFSLQLGLWNYNGCWGFPFLNVTW